MKKNVLTNLIIVSLIALSAVSCSKGKDPKTEEEKTFYAMLNAPAFYEKRIYEF